MPSDTESPSPVPDPAGLVVKKGSKSRGRISGGTPAPVSVTLTITSPVRVRRAWSVTCPVRPAA